jgi:hypothetical protein
MGRHCDSVRKEHFTAHPGAYWQMPRIFVIAYIAGLILLILGDDWVYLSIPLFLLQLLLTLNFIFYAHLFDRFFPKAEGSNVIGTVEPSGMVAQQIIVSGHFDSTYVYNYFLHLQKLFAFRVLGVYLFFFIGLCTSLLLSFYRFAYQSEPACSSTLRIILATGLLFVIPFFFYISRKGGPGAGDNLVACTLGIEIAELFSGDRAGRPLQRTRLIILNTDGEEPGLLGAQAFARAHREELLEVKTWVLNFDSIYKVRDLNLVTNDRNGTIRLSEAMVEDCRRIATELGYPIKAGPIPTGGGATDAARFAEIGVQAVSILAMSTAIIRNDLVFHTPKDIVENIEPEAVEACLKIAFRYILEKDRSV